ncbi:MAG: tetratricopeptide repeat protein [bacterium]
MALHTVEIGTIGRILLFVLLMVSSTAAFWGCASRDELIKQSTRHYEYGLVYLEQGDLAQAYEEFGKAREILPDDDRAHFGLGLALYFQGKFEQSFLAYQRAIALNPQVPEYYNNMAATLGKMARWKDVIEYCRVALDMPSYSTPGFAYYNMGCAYVNLGKAEKAIECLRKATDENPDYSYAHVQLGKALAMRGNYSDAILSLRQAQHLEVVSSSGDILLHAEIDYYLGQSYLGLGDTSSARDAFRSVIERAPGSKLAKDSATYLKGSR